MKLKDWIIEIFTYLLALLFFYTALSKLIDFKKFVWEIGNQPFQEWLKPILIYGLPTIELVAVYFLIRIKSRQAGYYLSAALLFVFTIYVGLVTFDFYKREPCSCAGVFHAMSWPQHLIFNIAFLIIAVFSIYLNSSKNQKKNQSTTLVT